MLPSWFCPSIAAGLYGTGLAGYMGFQQNRNIKGELAQASLFVFLKGPTAPTGSLGWRDERKGEKKERYREREREEGVRGAFFLPSIFPSFLSHFFLW